MKSILLLITITVTNQLNSYPKYPSQYAIPSLLHNPLHHLAFKGHYVWLEFLVESGRYNVNSSDHLGRTPLHCAAAAGHKKTVEKLILLDAEVDVKDNFMLLPEELAHLNGHKRLSRFLQEYRSLG